ncbi:Phosphoglycerate dehydrogenase or related dehydrogenase [Halalkaliarchaeum sp. AArc-CO]|uniref:C-terminal binding protein n=1 Tax=Halalkaliarchaeum sp. AArc-CO TaxID=2866381 RepID=UPI00217EC18A|nr:C-terminal binding protein [Halalkaliarchaeum sp. AArc-CO]UWG50961.1 Phosphoglycerate dehydrogenase or related dehydrogenase [Halalkaliarchaeum sp. AArc-CO]
MAKILVTDYNFPDLSIEQGLANGAGVELEGAQARSPEEIIEAAEGADGLLVQYGEVTEEVFEARPEIQVVGRYGIGVDSVDLDAATEHGVSVVNVPSYCLDEVSTHAMALILGCVRKVALFDREITGGTWDWNQGKPIHRLTEQTLGLAGFGEIPQTLARKAEAFGLDVIAYDPYLSAEEIAEHGARKVDFDELLAGSDVLSVHVPLTDETQELFDAAAFEQMRDHAFIVNTARGAVIDTGALAEALETGELAGAGLDVLPEEPPENSPLIDRDDVILTPHVAWYSEDSLAELRRTVTEDVIGVLNGDGPMNLVNTDV